MPAIPERQPLADSFRGAVLQAADTTLLARAALPETECLAQGALVIRYGIEYLGKPHLSIVPGLVALDYGEMLTGVAAWDFLLNRSNLHPRADVVGYRNDGTDDMIAVKYLDLAEGAGLRRYRRHPTAGPRPGTDRRGHERTASAPAGLSPLFRVPGGMAVP